MCCGDGSHLPPGRVGGVIKDEGKSTPVGGGEDGEMRGLKERERRAVVRRREREANGGKGEAGEEEEEGMESCSDYEDEEVGDVGEGSLDGVAEGVGELKVGEQEGAVQPAAKAMADAEGITLEEAESIFKMAGAPAPCTSQNPQPSPTAPEAAAAAAVAAVEDPSESESTAEHFGGGNDVFGCGSSRNDARFKF